MRIVWKDRVNNEYKPTKYRDHWIEGTYSGWYTDCWKEKKRTCLVDEPSYY